MALFETAVRKIDSNKLQRYGNNTYLRSGSEPAYAFLVQMEVVGRSAVENSYEEASHLASSFRLFWP
jgi:hypothetical protein